MFATDTSLGLYETSVDVRYTNTSTEWRKMVVNDVLALTYRMEANADGSAAERKTKPPRSNKPSCMDRRCTGVEAMAEASLERDRVRSEAAEQRAAEHHYNGFLLALAEDLGERMLKAFETPTSIPYGTVNLRHGIPPGETLTVRFYRHQSYRHQFYRH